MVGVRNKLLDMSTNSGDINFIIYDFSFFPKIIARFLGFWKGLFISPFTEKIIIRHTFVDVSLVILLIFRFILRNETYLEHHSDHLKEFKLRGRFGYLMSLREYLLLQLIQPLITGNIFLSKSIQKSLSSIAHKKPVFMENGVNWKLIKSYRRVRVKRTSLEKIKLIFVAGKFAPWHGLSSILEAIDLDRGFFTENFELTVIGEIPYDIQLECVKHHEQLSKPELFQLLQSADIAIDSLELSRLGLTTSSSLKAKEYIAFGLPIICEYPSRCDYIEYSNKFDGSFQTIKNWFESIDFDELDRTSRSIAEQHLDWFIILKNLVKDLK